MRPLAPSQVATLSVLATARPPAAMISSTTSCAGPASDPLPSFPPPRSLTTTAAPSFANSSACERPMPRPAPVMTATLLSSAPMSAHQPGELLERGLDLFLGAALDGLADSADHHLPF